MNERHSEIHKKKIEDLLQKRLIRKSNSPLFYPTFYVENAAEKERGVPRLIINYKPLNKLLGWIRHPLPNKKDLLNIIHSTVIFSKFDMENGYWQTQITKYDMYK